MKQTAIALLIYFTAVSLITAAVTAKDKLSAKKGRRRTPEKTLFLLAFLGGALSEYITMKLIRHKTQHKSFMLGLPAIIVLQVAIICAAAYFISVSA